MRTADAAVLSCPISGSPTSGSPTSGSLPIWIRHATHFGPACAIAAVMAAAAAASTPAHGLAKTLFVAFACVNAAVLALSSWPTLLGAVVAVAERFVRVPGLARPALTGTARTAVLVPVYGEDPAEVFAAVAALRASLPASGIGAVDCYVLSDTRDPALALEEERHHAALVGRINARARVRDGGAPDGSRAVYYRRRADNARRKAGNIEDFCVRWGSSYDFMVILDADSLMEGGSVAHLIGLMEANPRAGIVQAMCYAVGKTTLFARAAQFGARLSGPLLARGLSFWQGPRGSWWGHNAIIRVAPFMRHCGLPELPGRAPLGGDILSHDTIEAALMLRAGWEVWLSPEVAGSFEQNPTNIVDHLARDRRWCQGNMQHIGVIGADGLTLASRLHIGMGILHYMAGPLFIALLAARWACALAEPTPAAGIVQAGVVQAGIWPTLGAWLFVALLFGPKLVTLAWTMADRDRRESFGGAARLLAGVLAEQVMTMATGTVSMLVHIGFLRRIFAGTAVGWGSQHRADRGLGWSEAASRLGRPVAAGVAGCAVLALAGDAWVWMTTLPGLLLAIPVAVLSSRMGPGLRARRAGLFAIPEETAPPALFAAFAAELAQAQAAPASTAVHPTGSVGPAWGPAWGPAPLPPSNSFGHMPRQNLRRGRGRGQGRNPLRAASLAAGG